MQILKNIRKHINIKFSFLNRHFKNKSFNLLDIGAGNHSASRTTRLFPECRYYGLDIDRNYANDENDFRKMAGFYELDLTKLDYTSVPDSFFDVIVMTHVIEHLYNGDDVIRMLIPKLKPGGYFYIEYPGRKSTGLPSMYGTLNFYDDPTHVRIYSIEELKTVFENNNCTIIQSGTRRNYYYIFAMPFRIIVSLIRFQKLSGNLFWDVLGFAEYLKVRKNST